MIYEGKIFDLDVPNANGRVYSTEVITKAVDAYNEKIRNGTALGQLGMPVGLSVSFAEVSHTVEEIRIEDGKAFAKVRILSTPPGNVVKELIRAGARTDQRTAGSGHVDEHGVVTDFQITSVNVVGDGA